MILLFEPNFQDNNNIYMPVKFIFRCMTKLCNVLNGVQQARFQTDISTTLFHLATWQQLDCFPLNLRHCTAAILAQNTFRKKPSVGRTSLIGITITCNAVAVQHLLSCYGPFWWMQLIKYQRNATACSACSVRLHICLLKIVC